MEKTLTVSIAAYNVARYIEKTLESFTDPDIRDRVEVLVINDGSKDETPEIARRYEKEYEGTIRLIDKENGGWGSTVNRGISEAKGKYFKLLDGDDYFDRDELKKLLDLLEKTDADLIYTEYVSFEDETDREIEHVKVKEGLPTGKVLNIRDIEVDFTMAMHACTFKTELIKGKFKILEKCFYTDIEYLIKSLVNVDTVLFENIGVYRYRLGRAGQSASFEGLRKHYKEHIRVTEELLSFYDGIEDPKMKKIAGYRLWRMTDYQYYIFLVLEATKEHAGELADFDRKLKESYPEFYKTDRSRIKAFRLLGKGIYRFIVYK